MAIYQNITQVIGSTPLVRLHRLEAHYGSRCALYAKCEYLNPSGSIKDRTGLNMIVQAEKRGTIRPGQLIVEATAGNTGLGLALASRMKGYKLLLVIPDKMSNEKINHLRALGVEVVITRSDVGKGHPEYYQDLAAKIANERGGYYINQFENPDNPDTHFLTTGPEIWEQMEHKVDAVVVGVGSAGTLSGLTKFFKTADRIHPSRPQRIYSC